MPAKGTSTKAEATKLLVKKALELADAEAICMRFLRGENRARIAGEMPQVNLRTIAKVQCAAGLTKANDKVREQDRAIVVAALTKSGADSRQIAAMFKRIATGAERKRHDDAAAAVVKSAQASARKLAAKKTTAKKTVARKRTVKRAA